MDPSDRLIEPYLHVDIYCMHLVHAGSLMSTPGRPLDKGQGKNTEKNVHGNMPCLLIHPEQQGDLLVNYYYKLKVVAARNPCA